MLYYDIFEHYDPLTGEMPKYHSNYFDWVARRAKKILHNRSSEEIENAYDMLAWLDGEHGYYALESEETRGKPLAEFPEHYRENFAEFSDGRDAIQFYIGDSDLSDFEDFPNATWAEYLSVIALGKIAEAHQCVIQSEEYRAKKPATTLEEQQDALRMCSLYLVEAVDAIALAEQYQDTPDTSKRSHKKHGTDFFKETGRKGGINKNKPFVPIRKKVLTIYDSEYAKKSISNANAAHRIWGRLTDEEQKIFKSQDPIKRLEKWIGRHLHINRNNVLSQNAVSF